MAGPGAGFVRLTIEAGASRFSAQTLVGNKPVDAELLMRELSPLSGRLQDTLERVKVREGDE